MGRITMNLVVATIIKLASKSGLSHKNKQIEPARLRGQAPDLYA